MTGLLYLVGLVVVSTLLYLAQGGDGRAWLPADDAKQELVKIGFQVLVFGLVGGGVKLLLDYQAEARRFRSDILERLGRAHQEVYRVRRSFSAASDEEKRALLGVLMDARQELGATSHVLRIGSLGLNVKEIRTEMKAMREYLKKVIHAGLTAPSAPEHQAFTDFLRWQETEGPYKVNFKDRYRRVKELVDPRSIEPEEPPKPTEPQAKSEPKQEDDETRAA